MTNDAKIELIQNWFFTQANRNPDKPSFWTLLKGSTAGGKEILGKNDYETDTTSSFDLLIDQITTSHQAGGVTRFYIKYMTAVTASKTVGQPLVLSRSIGIGSTSQNSSNSDHIGRVERGFQAQLQQQQLYNETCRTHDKEIWKLEQQVRDLENENAALIESKETLMDKVMDRYQPTIEAIAGRYFGVPQTQIAVSGFKGDQNKQQQIQAPVKNQQPVQKVENTQAPAARQPDLNYLIAAYTTLASVFPNADILIHDIAVWAVSHKQEATFFIQQLQADKKKSEQQNNTKDV